MDRTGKRLHEWIDEKSASPLMSEADFVAEMTSSETEANVRYANEFACPMVLIVKTCSSEIRCHSYGRIADPSWFGWIA